MPSYAEIYDLHAGAYDELVRYEDKDHNLSAWLDTALTPTPAVCVELGAGTGRVTRMLAPRCGAVRAYEGSAHMVDAAKALFSNEKVTFAVADNASLPEASGSADAVVAGWTIGHVTGFFPDDWEAHARRSVDEMLRIARPGALVVIIQTLGTCVERPGAPNDRLRAYYTLLEGAYGFARAELATDYQFPTAADALRVMSFFFGESMADRVRARSSAVIPEWTGVWSRRVP